MTPAPQNRRHREVLTDVVRAYIETGEPVSSRSIARHHQEPLSAATVRNVMADLEDEGYLYQPHTSAGRVPTAEAYRFFVEEVATQAIAQPQDMEWIRRELAAAPTPEAVMERASKILAEVSKGLGIIIAPPLARATVEHLRFLTIPEGRVLVVLIGAGGATRDKVIRPERAFRQDELDRVADHLNRHYSGWTLEAIRSDLQSKLASDRARYEQLANDALILCDPQLLEENPVRQVYVEGAARLAASGEFTNPEHLSELLATIEERSRLVALLSGCIEGPEPVHVELGIKEIAVAGSRLALVTAPYTRNERLHGAQSQGPQSQGAPLQGTLGILGPMRMHYERVITAVAFMAQFFSAETKVS